MVVSSLSQVQLFATPWTEEPARHLCPWDFPGKIIGVGCHFLLQGIFPTWGLNLCLHLAGGFLTTEPPGKPIFISFMCPQSVPSPSYYLFPSLISYPSCFSVFQGKVTSSLALLGLSRAFKIFFCALNWFFLWRLFHI